MFCCSFSCLFFVPVISILSYYVYCRLMVGLNKCSKHLVSKVVVVTGGNAGIGYEAAKDLADRGAKVIIGCRNEDRGKKARDMIIEATGNKEVLFKHLDLASLASVREFARFILETEKRLDILINNAGIADGENKKTEDGLLLTMQSNYFGHFLLTNLLLPLIKSSAPSRIINVSSAAYKFGDINFDNLNMEKVKRNFGIKLKSKVYSNSKLCNVLMTVELARQLKGSGVSTYSLCPGAVNTEILKSSNIRIRIFAWVLSFFNRTTWEGAQTSIYLAVSPGIESLSGCYFTDCKKEELTAKAKDAQLARKLWEVSERLVKIKE